jgi:WD40 repeat protein
MGIELYKYLDGHSGWVKGVAWDPTGKFIASHVSELQVISGNISSLKTIH